MYATRNIKARARDIDWDGSSGAGISKQASYFLHLLLSYLSNPVNLVGES